MVQLQLVKGKAEFVKRRKPDGTLEDVCLCDWNTDFAFACIGQVHDSLLKEVIGNNGSYDKEKIKEHRANVGIDFRCEYCYAKRKNWGKVTPKTIGEKTVQQFEEERPKIIRLGKNTECGHPFYKGQLVEFLKLCREYDTQIIFPNKMLEFDKRIATLLRITGSVLNYSLCNDSLEQGAVSQGFSNSWRAEQAMKYTDAGVNTTVTLTCDVTNSLDGNIEKGFAIQETLDAKSEGILLRLLPLRISSRKLCYKVTGREWGEIINPANYEDALDLGIEWRYAKKGNNEAFPLFFHRDFQTLVDEGIGVCGRVGKTEYCDECNLRENVRIKFPASELVQIKRYVTKVTYKKYKRKTETSLLLIDPSQGNLF